MPVNFGADLEFVIRVTARIETRRQKDGGVRTNWNVIYSILRISAPRFAEIEPP